MWEGQKEEAQGAVETGDIEREGENSGSVRVKLEGYTLSVPNIRNTLIILSCTPFCPQNSLNLSGHGLYKVSKAFHRDAGP